MVMIGRRLTRESLLFDLNIFIRLKREYSNFENVDQVAVFRLKIMEQIRLRVKLTLSTLRF